MGTTKRRCTNSGLSSEKFFTLIKKGESAEVWEYLKTNSSNVNKVGRDGKSPLFHALVTENHEMVKILLEAGADIEKTSFVSYHRDFLVSCDEPPLVTAARLDSLELLSILLDYGASVDSTSQFHPPHTGSIMPDRTALHFACENGNLKMVQKLLKFLADVNVEDRKRGAALLHACRCKKQGDKCMQQTRIVHLLCEHGADVNFAKSLESTPLYTTAFYGCQHKAEVLLMYGADVNKCEDWESKFGSPLHITAMQDRAAFCRLLISYGAKLDTLNAQGSTAAMVNMHMFGQSDVVWLCIYHGARLDIKYKGQRTLLHMCIGNMRLDCELLAKYLVYAGYDLNQDHWLQPKFEWSQPLDDQQGEEEGVKVAVPDIEIPEGRISNLCDWLREQQCQPSSLADICRIRIRRHLSIVTQGRSIEQSVCSLPVPTAIADYIMIKSLYDGTQGPLKSTKLM